jgi:hypothetical protein
VALYPVECLAEKAALQLQKCRDDTMGIEKMRECAHDAAKEPRVALGRLGGDDVATGACGLAVTSAIRARLQGTVIYLDDLDRWLMAHQSHLKTPMETKSLAAACEGSLCQDMPKAEALGYAQRGAAPPLDSTACTASLFICGSPDAACSLDEVAKRLGVACDPKDNRTSAAAEDHLYVRATHKLVAPQ